eukprot:CAMPEP_0202697310 /NCGR_PEP_ID=MMETSP1385-20130828/10635_1 /ASSEMBLY_ACC=CAM_ASM_000861 /TAXON_ID=933848 /ORGANISM="Elphidium margaritaceum" /LENGTH=580 /DNA_ID=CAMNT_0049353739 /DNA_START=63 /DNA_END=1805 /DNA_ORIENTATION=-
MNDGHQLYVKHLFDRAMETRPDSEIVTHTRNGNTHRMSYREFGCYTSRLASSLRARFNIGVGDVVSSFMWNNVRHMALYYSVPCMGSVLCPLNIRLHSTELAYILRHALPQVIFVDENLLRNFEKILDVNPLKHVRAFIICGDCQQTSNYRGQHPLLVPRAVDFDDLLSAHGSETFYGWPKNLDERSGCFLNYTSGTTGNPKGILNSHRSTSIRTIVELMRYSGNDCILGLPPMFHACGWGMSFVAMASGAKIILNNTCYDYDTLADLVLSERVTRMCGVPTMIEDFCRKLKQNPTKYQNKLCVREIRCGGAVCPAHIISYLQKVWNIELSHGWGMSECMPGCHNNRIQRRRDLHVRDADALTANQMKQGTFNPVMETRLVNTDHGDYDNTIAKDGKTVGELLIKGPCIAKSYYKMGAEQRRQRFTKDDFLITGDVVTITERDEMCIVDRSKDLIKSGGEWIASSDMEKHVMQLSNRNIQRCAVVAQPHPRWSERPVLIVQRAQKEQESVPSKQEILTHLSLKYAKFQIVDDILFWETIPLTGTGKISKKNIRNILKQQQYVLPQLRNDTIANVTKISKL